MRSKIFILASIAIVIGCKSTGQLNSQLQNGPRIDNQAVAQGGKIYINNCNAGGHEGPTTGSGWPFNEKEGCYLDCRDESALKQDFLHQLKRHRIYGDINLISQMDPDAGRAAKQLADKLATNGIQMNRFDQLTTNELYDGANWKNLDIKKGDILLNMNFGRPNHAGIFYAKRGMGHARLVVDVTPDEIHTFDGGWNKFSQLDEVNAQTVWLRPRAKFLKDGDIANLVKWAKIMEPIDYDNTLTDDWHEFRNYLHQYLDSGMNNFEAREKAFNDSKTKGFDPLGFQESFKFLPPSGLYCSEGTAGIFSYLGFRQHGETAIDIATAFSSDGNLPDWKLYEDALSGFGADSDKNTYMMHKLFFDYFTVFDAGRKSGAIKIPGLENSQTATFTEAATANLKAVAADNYGASNHLDSQLEEFENALAAGGTAYTKEKQQVADLRSALSQVALMISQQAGKDLNISQTVFNIFYANKAYGPHTFFENGKYFELKGVFYNSNLRGNQALFISDWWLQTFGQEKKSANVQTTLYRIKNDRQLPADRCVVAEKAPIIPTK